MGDEFSQRNCDDRNKTIHENRKQDRQWIQSLEDKYNGMTKAIYTTLGIMIVNLLTIIIVYILLRAQIQ